MGIDINRLTGAGFLLPGRAVDKKPNSIPYFSSSTLKEDRFESSTPEKYTTEFMINKLVRENPKLNQMLNSPGIPYNLNIDELKNILDTHCKDTRLIAEGIVNSLPFSLKNKANLSSIKDAAYLHDIGKVFIPKEILCKNGPLEGNEIDIMHSHAELGYELLKNTNINPKTLHLIRNHHQNAKKNGYPAVGKNFFADLDLQILSLADKYSALTEQRPYKPAFESKKALGIIYQDVRDGKLNPIVYNALVSYVTKADNNFNITPKPLCSAYSA